MLYQLGNRELNKDFFGPTATRRLKRNSSLLVYSDNIASVMKASEHQEFPSPWQETKTCEQRKIQLWLLSVAHNGLLIKVHLIICIIVIDILSSKCSQKRF